MCIVNSYPISIIMPVYNSSNYLYDSINSIIRQSFKNYEYIIIDDGSKDDSFEIVKSFKDKRLKILRNKINLGVSKTQNIGIKHAKGKYIIRLDSDDIADRERIKIQYKFMERNPEIGVCGSWVKAFGNKKMRLKYPLNNEDIKASLIFNSAFAQPSVIIRREVLYNNDILYNEKYSISEDYDLWERLSHVTKFANINKYLVKYCQHNAQTTKLLGSKEKVISSNIRKRVLLNMGITYSNKEYEIHSAISNWDLLKISQNIYSVEQWLYKLVVYANKLNNNSLNKIVVKKWNDICRYILTKRKRQNYFFNSIIIHKNDGLNKVNYLIESIRNLI